MLLLVLQSVPKLIILDYVINWRVIRTFAILSLIKLLNSLQGFKSRIEDVREEILRKRRAGKLPGDTTTILKQWWQQHSKWPYPTVSTLYLSSMLARVQLTSY